MSVCARATPSGASERAGRAQVGSPAGRYAWMMNEAQPPAGLDPGDLDGVYDQFCIHDAGEIRHYLLRLVGERCGLVARAEGSADSMGVMVLKVDAAALWIDVPASAALREAWLGAQQLRMEGSIDRAAMRFASGPARLESHEQRPALRLPLPARVLYMQRREFVRREPLSGSLRCRLRLHEGKAELVARVGDIGGGGMAVIVTRSEASFDAGDRLDNCRIDLPEIGEVEVSLLIRHVHACGHLGHDLIQIGCEFVGLTAQAQRKLSRYLMQLDREWASRRRRDD